MRDPILALLPLSLFHILIPSHWLCFVVVGRAHAWKPRHTMMVAAVAGVLHVLATVTLGIVLRLVGAALLDAEKLEKAGAIVLVALGLVYLVLHFRHAGHHHDQDRTRGGRLAFLALVFSLSLSPCSAAIPVLVVEIKDWSGVWLVGAILLLTTPGTMALLVGLAALGIDRLRFEAVERYEKLLVGLVLLLLGALLLWVDRH
jgi:putative Mn2+ efflux pump MntP